MNEIFKVGEVAILQNCTMAGLEVTITNPLQICRILHINGEVIFAEAYEVDLRAMSGKPYGAFPSQLRKKRPPEAWTGEMRIKEMFTPAAIDAAIKIDLMALLNSVK